MKGTKNKAFPKAIPIITVKSEKYAKQLQVYFGSVNMYDKRYMYARFKGTLEHLNFVELQFKAAYAGWVAEEEFSNSHQ